MSEQTEDGLQQIQESGRWLRLYGFYPIISAIILFAAIIFVIFYIISTVATTNTINSQDLNNTVNFVVFMIYAVALLIALGEIFIIYKLYVNLRDACKYDLIERGTMQKTLLPLKVGILLRLLSSIVPLIVVIYYYMSGIAIIEVSSTSQLTTSRLTSLQTTSYVGIINLLFDGALLYSMYVLHEWTVQISNSYPSPMTNDAVTGMNYVRISLGLTTAIALLNVFGINISLVGFISFILLVVGASKAGKAFRYFAGLRTGDYNRFQMNAGYSYQPVPMQSNITSKPIPASYEQVSTSKTCPQCSNPVSEANKFCQNCGYSFLNQPTTSKCSTCQSDLDPDTIFCSTCGTKAR